MCLKKYIKMDFLFYLKHDSIKITFIISIKTATIFNLDFLKFENSKNKTQIYISVYPVVWWSCKESEIGSSISCKVKIYFFVICGFGNFFYILVVTALKPLEET